MHFDIELFERIWPNAKKSPSDILLSSTFLYPKLGMTVSELEDVLTFSWRKDVNIFQMKLILKFIRLFIPRSKFLHF